MTYVRADSGQPSSIMTAAPSGDWIVGDDMIKTRYTGELGRDWLTLREAADEIGVSPRTIRRWIQRGRLVAEKRAGQFGEQYYVSPDSLESPDPEASEEPDTPIQEPPEPSSPTAPEPSSMIFGRDQELSDLRKALQVARSGSGRLILIGGEAGIGKTALVQQFLGHAVSEGALVLIGHCYDLEAAAPYGPWVEMLRRYRPDGDLLSPPSILISTGLDDRVSGSTELYTQLWHFLTDLAVRQPLLIVLEDQHWADQESLELVRVLSRLVSDQPILIVLTYRDIELGEQQPLYPLLPLLTRENDPLRFNLRRLEWEDVEALVSTRYDLAAEQRDRLTEYLWRYAEGNPLFTGELLIALEDERHLSHDDDGWSLGAVDQLQMPQLVRQVLDSRLARLSQDALRRLQVAAVIGADVSYDLWQAVSEAADEELVETIEQALAARLVEESADGRAFSFRHALIREALYSGLIAPRRRIWHLRIGEAMSARRDADPEPVAYHFLQAGDDRAADWLIEAGTRAASLFALQRAVEHFERAETILDGNDDRMIDRIWLLCELGEACRYTDPQRAARCLDEARARIEEVDDSALRSVVLWCRARIRGALGDATLGEFFEADELYESLDADDQQRVLNSPVGYVARAGVHAQWLALHGLFQQGLDRAEQHFHEAEKPAEGRGYERVGHATALFGLGIAHAALGSPDEARAGFLNSTEIFQEIGNDQLVWANLMWYLDLVLLVYYPDRPGERARVLSLADDSWRPSQFADVRQFRQLASLTEAQLIDARWEELRDAATAMRNAGGLGRRSARFLAELDRCQGYPDRAWSYITVDLPNGPDTEPSVLFIEDVLNQQRIAAELALDVQNLELALRWIEALERWLDWSGKVAGRAVPEMLRARFSRTSGDLDRARDHARTALRLASDPRQPLAMMRAHRLIGELELHHRHIDEACQHLEAALALAQACAAPYELALSQIALAELHLATGETDEALALLAEVRARAEALEAAPLLQRVEAIAERAAVEPAAPAPPSLLSPRELEVLTFVSRGLTDAEIAEQLFISPRTVSGHLQSIFNKLGLSSRTAATAFAYEHNLI